MERARAQILKNIELVLNNSDQVGLTLSEFIGAGDWRLFFLHRDRLRKVTPEEVSQVADKYFKPSNRTLGLFIPTPKPDRAEIPAMSDLTAALKDYKGDAGVAAGEAFDPSPADIESRTVRSEAGGIKLALLRKKTRGGKVVAQMAIRYGDEQSLITRNRRADGGQHAHARHHEAHAPADSGRAGSFEGPRQRQRWRHAGYRHHRDDA